MRHSVPTLVLAMAMLSSLSLAAQDASDVETKAYGSYTGGKFDTVDLSTGNLFLDIPLLSYAQRGKLPPLSFSVELNNSPYTRSVICYPDQGDPGDTCFQSTLRYDTSAPGSIPGYGIVDPFVPGSGSGKVGAYITSSYEGPLVNGTAAFSPSAQGEGSTNQILTYSAQMLYSLIDPGGKTHALESGSDNLNNYHAQDGTGWTFMPAGSGNAYDAFDPENYGLGYGNWPASAPYWLTSPSQSLSGTGLRLGTVLSPTGINYSYQLLPEPELTTTLQTGTGTETLSTTLLTSTATDPMGNTITRGPWYSTAQQAGWSTIRAFFAEPANQPQFIDSIGRNIPDIVTLQELGQVAPGSTSGSCPAGTTSVPWSPPGPAGGTLSYMFCYTSMKLTLAVGEVSPQTVPESGTMNVLTSIILPNQTQWTFTYDPNTTNLLKVGLPTGGSISYTYELVPDSRCTGNPCEGVTSRTEDDGLGHTATNTYTYGYSDVSSPVPPYTNTQTFTTTETDSFGNDTVHTFGLIGTVSTQLFETGTVSYQGSAAAVPALALKSVSTDYAYRWDFLGAGMGYRAIAVFPAAITTTNPSRSSQTYVTRAYSSDAGSPLFTARRIICTSSSTVARGDDPSTCGDSRSASGYPLNSDGVSTNAPTISYLEPTSETLSWFAPPNATPLQITTKQFQFQADTAYKAANLIDLPRSIQVQGGGYYWQGTASSLTTYGYDEPNRGPQAVLGNLTSKTVAYSIGYANSFVASTGTVYDGHGMPTAQIDPKGNATTISYDATGLFVSSIQKPTINGVPHVDYFSYDPSLGYLNWHTDENGSAAQDVNHTTFYTHDLMGRVTGITYPDGGGSKFCYTDLGGDSCTKSGPPFQLYTTTLGTPDPAVRTMHTYDGLGRPIQSSVLSDPLGADLVDTVYDTEGRVQSVSNPYRASSPDSTAGLTVYAYDALGRKTLQTQPDGGVQQWCYDGVATNGQTNCSAAAARTYLYPLGIADWVDFSDEKGNHSQHITNPMGQLVGVMEPSPATGALSLETDYSYDVLGDLLSVNQLGSNGSAPRTRFFQYYAPSMVSFSCNPETLAPGQSCSATNSYGIHYSYDLNGNVIQKTDNRGTSTSYSYDALNRLLGKTYSDGATPSSCYQYDVLGASNNGIGRLANAWTQSASAGACSTSAPFWSKRSVLAYDAMGRILNEQQCTPANCSTANRYSPAYTYNLAGKVSTFTNGITGTPTVGTLTFTNAYDAAGRLQTLSSNWIDATHPGTLFSAQAGVFTSCSSSTASYSPFGGLINATYGNGLFLNRSYDRRQRTICEVDSGYGGNQPATSGFAVLQLTGQEQGK